MAILSKPLYSDVARGSIGQVITYKRNPRNPIASAFPDHFINWTPAKVAQAQAFKALCNQWRALSGDDRAAWSLIAPGALTGFNWFMHFNFKPDFAYCGDGSYCGDLWCGAFYYNMSFRYSYCGMGSFCGNIFSGAFVGVSF